MASTIVRKGQILTEDFTWIVESPAGMSIPCEVTAFFVVDEDTNVKQPFPSAMMKRTFRQQFAEWYQKGEWILSLGYSPVARINGESPLYCITQVAAYRLATEEGLNTFVRCGPNEFENEAQEVLSTFTFGCCATKLVNFRKGQGWTEELIRENTKVAEIKSIETVIPADQRYSMAVEYSAARAEKEIRDNWQRVVDAQDEQSLANPCFAVNVQRVGQNVRIDWKIQDSVKEGRLLGFMREGGFHHDAWAGTPENGSLEIDSREKEGRVGQYLEAGRTYYYTLYIAPRLDTSFLAPKGATIRYDEAVTRFQVRIPSVAELRAQGFSTNGGTWPEWRREAADTTSEQLSRLRERLKKSYQLNRGKAEILNEIRAEIAASNLPEADKDDVQRQLEFEAEKVWKQQPPARQ